VSSLTHLGIAPLQGYSYEEELYALRAPSQTFATAIDDIRWTLRRIPDITLVRFRHLPEQWRPKNSDDAQRLRRLLGFDALLWGTYVSLDPPRVWLNVASDYGPSSGLGIDGDDAESGGAELRDESLLFPFSVEQRIETGSFVIDQDQPSQVHAILVLAVAQSVVTRRALGSRLKRLGLGDDYLYQVHIAEILVEQMIADVFPLLTGSERPNLGAPSVAAVAAEVVGDWVGSRFHNPTLFPQRLEVIAARAQWLGDLLDSCMEMNPSSVRNFYRAVAVSVMLGEQEAALEYAREASRLDDFRAIEVNVLPLVYAEMALESAQRNSGFESRVDIARFSAHAARALNLGGSGVDRKLEELLEGAGDVLTSRLGGEPTGVAIVRRLLSESS
jgi:hypothetical protein